MIYSFNPATKKLDSLSCKPVVVTDQGMIDLVIKCPREVDGQDVTDFDFFVAFGLETGYHESAPTVTIGDEITLKVTVGTPVTDRTGFVYMSITGSSGDKRFSSTKARFYIYDTVLITDPADPSMLAVWLDEIREAVAEGKSTLKELLSEKIQEWLSTHDVSVPAATATELGAVLVDGLSDEAEPYIVLSKGKADSRYLTELPDHTHPLPAHSHDQYVLKQAGMGLSHNDLTDTRRDKVDAIPDDPQYTDTIADLSDYYTKDQVDGKLTSALTYKGTVQTYADLPSLTAQDVGHMYNIAQAGSQNKAGDNAVWAGDHWDILSGVIDLSRYATKSDLNDKQNKLSPGTGITIIGDTISAAGGDVSLATQDVPGLVLVDDSAVVNPDALPVYRNMPQNTASDDMYYAFVPNVADARVEIDLFAAEPDTYYIRLASDGQHYPGLLEIVTDMGPDFGGIVASVREANVSFSVFGGAYNYLKSKRYLYEPWHTPGDPYTVMTKDRAEGIFQPLGSYASVDHGHFDLDQRIHALEDPTIHSWTLYTNNWRGGSGSTTPVYGQDISSMDVDFHKILQVEGEVGIIHLDFVAKATSGIVAHIPTGAPKPRSTIETQLFDGSSVWVSGNDATIRTSTAVVGTRYIFDLIGFFK